MPKRRRSPFLKIKGGVYKNIDAGILPGQMSSVFIDGYENENEDTVKRPGLTTLKDLGTSALVNGVYYWYIDDIYVAGSNGNLYSITSNGTSQVTLSGGVTVNADNTLRFAHDGTNLWIADGASKLTYFASGSGPGTLLRVADADAPTAPTHVCFLDQYILANDKGSNQVHWCVDPATLPNTWQTLDWVNPESEPDPVLSVHVFESEIYMFGNKSLEIWRNDGETPFSRILTLEIGSGAVDGVVYHGGLILWMDQNRRIMTMTTGRKLEMISMPIYKELSSYTTVYDMKAFPISIGGQDFVVFTFPTENRTWTYNLISETWSRWGKWDEGSQGWSRYKIHCSDIANITVTDANITRVDYIPTIGGDRDNGKLYKIDEESFQDDSLDIRMVRRSGNLTSGTLKKKKIRNLGMQIKMPSVSTTYNTYPWTKATGNWDTPHAGNWEDLSTDVVTVDSGLKKFSVRWRDNDADVWKPERHITIDGRNNRNNTVTLRKMGMYITRQYEIIHKDNSGFIMSNIEEDAGKMTA